MKKIGIITLIGYTNYGNRLQNYATQEVIKSLGYKAETIKNYPQNIDVKSKIISKLKEPNLKSYIKLIISMFKKVRFRVYKTKNEDERLQLNQLREKKFIEFTNQNIKETDFVITPNSIPSGLEKEYDFFVVGSDQVWNSNYRHGSPIDFLTFATSKKRIAYSASFGVSNIPASYIQNYKDWLNEMPHISVREESGAKIVKDLTGRDVPVLIDPTMMLTKEKWLEISRPADKKPSEPYLLAYFLGQVSEEKSQWIRNIADDNELTIINLANINDKDYYCADPSQFIALINNCNIFCTDSFHGVVFSVLFEKPFVVFERISETPSMSSRIDTILSKFKFESRKWENIKKTDDLYNINFSHTSEIFVFERKKSIDYLKNALDI